VSPPTPDPPSVPTIVREPARAPGLEVDIDRAAGGTTTAARDVVAVEEPLEIWLNGWRWLVTMRTPGDDGDLIVGLLASEGVIDRAADVESIVFTRHPEEPDLANVADVRLGRAIEDLQARLARHQTMAVTSCGLCGKSAVEALLVNRPALPPGPFLDVALLAKIPALLAGAQPVFRTTGGLHAAALLDGAGTLLVAREDVGRHNAVDKVVGAALLHRLLPLSRCVLQVSGRTSFEIVQKARRAGVPIVSAVSAPSSLAVLLARDGGQTLIGFARADALNVYCGAERVRAPAAAKATAAAATAAPSPGAPRRPRGRPPRTGSGGRPRGGARSRPSRPAPRG
jgi:FdhD protein